jgi:hypothetical protein
MKLSYYAEIELEARFEQYKAEGEESTREEILKHEFIKCDCGTWVLPEEASGFDCVECMED